MICLWGDFMSILKNYDAEIHINKYLGKEKVVEIPEGTVYVHHYAFVDNKHVEKIVFPSTMDFVYLQACNDCKALKEIEIRSGIEKVDCSVLENCPSLVRISIPKTVVDFSPFTISNGINENCEIVIDKKNPFFESRKGCVINKDRKSLIFAKNVECIPEDVCIIESGGINIKNEKVITIPESIERVEGWATSYNDTVETIRFNGAIFFVDEKAFNNCNNLKRIEAPKASFEAFGNLKIPAICGFAKMVVNGEKIDEKVFEEYEKYIKSQKTRISKVEDENISKMLEVLLGENASKTNKSKSVTVAELKKIWSWKELGNDNVVITRYKGNDSVVIVPAMIGKKKVTEIGEQAFGSLKEPSETLTKVTISDGIKKIGASAFYNCKALAEIVLPDSITEIESYAFAGTVVSEIVLPKNLTELNNIFSKSKNLREVVLQEGLKKINSCAFNQCENLEKISIPSTLKDISEDAFVGCHSLESIVVAKNDACYEKDGYLYSSEKDCIIAHLASNKHLPKDLNVLSKALYSYSDITEIEIPAGVKVIGRGAFEYCTKLEKVVLPHTVTTIEPEAFYNCKALKEIVIPNGVTTIGVAAFFACTSLEKVDFLPEELEGISRSLFEKCINIKEVIIPKKVKTIGGRAFCQLSLDTLDIPPSVERLETYAFANACIEKLVIPETVKYLGNSVFYNMPTMVMKVYFRVQKPDKSWDKGWKASTFGGLSDSNFTWGYKR